MSESFEGVTFPPAGWTLYNLDASVMNWAQNDYFYHDGEFSALHMYQGGEQDGWLVTPQILLPESGPMLLAFWSSIIDADFYYKSSVLISTTGNDPETNNFTEVWTPSVLTETWNLEIINLAAYAGQSIYVAFRYEGDFAHSWAIDDVSISNGGNPVLHLSATEINATGSLSKPTNKNLVIKNNGIGELTYSSTVSYSGENTGWLTMSNAAATVPGGSNIINKITCTPTNLEVGDYHATITMTTNDPQAETVTIAVNYTLLEASTVGVGIMIQEYTFPYALSDDGKFVAISSFGYGGFLWEKNVGLTQIYGEESTVYGVSNEGVIAGSLRNPAVTMDGENVMMAGYWDKTTQDWTYLGLNPDAGDPVYPDYNTAWGISGDGSTIVGMQYYPGYNYKAFTWTQAAGYTNIGDAWSGGNRPNGISRDGKVIYGWADLPLASRSPVVWYNGTPIELADDLFGEAMGASSDGYYVVGYADQFAFIWSPDDETTLFENTLNDGSISATCVSDNGTVFGYTVEGFPPFPDMRRAFTRLITGELMTFNEYAANRGMFDADEWLFYSISGVTPDESKVIGAGITPSGEDVSFIIDFNAEIPTIEVTPTSLTATLSSGETQTHNLTIKNIGNAPLNYNAVVHFLPDTKQNLPVFADNENTVSNTTDSRASNFSSQKKRATATSQVKKAKVTFKDTVKDPLANCHTYGIKRNVKNIVSAGQSNTAKSKESFVLHYDGENVDALGLNNGGTFYNAVKFPATTTQNFRGATLTEVRTYINDIPTSAKIMIYSQGTATTPGEVIYEQNITNIISGWQTVTLQTPVVLNGNDLWVGLKYTHDPYNYVAGFDGGPASGYATYAKIEGDDWENLAAEFSFNWNIRATLQLTTGEWLTLNPTEGSIDGGSNQNVVLTFDASKNGSVYYGANIIITSNDAENPLIFVPVTMEVLVGLANNVENNIEVYPIPANDYINIRMTQDVKQIKLSDIAGRVILEEFVYGQNEKTISLTSVQTGIYTVTFVLENGKTENKTIVIQK